MTEAQASDDGEAPAKPEKKKSKRFYALDGWRAISILLVLGSHMLPLGPRALNLNTAAGQAGMALFFTLSGFLITTQLYHKRHIGSFYIRRLFRIVPLAWAYTLIATIALGLPLGASLAMGTFSLNYQLDFVQHGIGHYWSLCVEVHFYAAIGLWMVLTRFKGFKAIPLFWAGLVAYRLVFAAQGTIETHFRVDEILSGAVLGCVHLGLFGDRPKRFLDKIPFVVPAVLLFGAAHPDTSYFGAFRGLFASVLVGHTLLRSERDEYKWLGNRALRYVAETSYALYVVHPVTLQGWFGTGDNVFIRYGKRALSFAITFALAHLSTFYYELPITNLGRKLAKRVEGQKPAPAPTAE